MRQLDLFQDSPRTIALNVLREAILARNAPGAGIALEPLLSLDPGHERASDARTLIAVLEAPAPEGPDEGIEWLHDLEREWRPAAIRLLGTGDDRDFLAPVWRCIGGALGPRPFDPVHPERHAVLRGLVDDPGFPDAGVAAAWGAAEDQDVPFAHRCELVDLLYDIPFDADVLAYRLQIRGCGMLQKSLHNHNARAELHGDLARHLDGLVGMPGTVRWN